jgi:endonuclease I/V8-like Glu-specific endopeptidase
MDMKDKLLELSQDVEARYDARAGERQDVQEKIAEAKAKGLDVQDEHVRERLERLQIDPETKEPILLPPGDGEKGFVAAPVDPNVLERILGLNDLISVRFLEQGWIASRAVGRIHIASGLGFGTGFMISPRLLLTNNHVLEDKNTAALSFVEFDYQLGIGNRRPVSQEFDLAPEEFFLTDKGLDFTLVAVRPVNQRDMEVRAYGWLPLSDDENKVIAGEMLNIIQHPGGERKQLALRENRLEDILEQYLHYQTDTAPGSSGAPVFNDQWEVVALHHAGVPKRDEEGNLLTLDNRIWDDSMSITELAWKANEGVRISRIIKFINDAELAEGEAALWAEARDGELPSIDDVPQPVIAPVRSVGPQSVAAPAAPGAPAVAGGRDVPEKLAEPMAELAEFNGRPYYELEKDEADRQEYYGSLAPPPATTEPAFDLTTADGWHITVVMQQAAGGQNGGQSDSAVPTYDQLHELLTSTHANQPSYNPSQEVYPWVDLHEDGMLRSIYSGKIYNPADFMEKDLVIESRRVQQLQAFRARESAVTETAVAGFEALLEAQLPYNCEHVVPQSWFSHNEPMRGDLHHLFACESGCNSFRSNIPYYDFEDFGEATRSECGKRDGNRFEPDAGKGAISRAVFYFLVRYPGLVEDLENEFEKERLPFLLAWHNRYPVTDYERHRNMAIFAKQGNRNPFIDFPEWANHIDFVRGLG